MALAAWQATIVDAKGNVQANAQITVLREVAGQPPAACFSDRDGTMALGSTFNADENGFVRFHAAGGAYQITATKGGFTRMWRWVAIGLGAESDLQFVRPMGAWTAEESYLLGDLVTHGEGLLFISLQGLNLGNEPDNGSPPGDTEWWMFAGELGEGPQGPQGPQGDPGPQGPPGADGDGNVSSHDPDVVAGQLVHYVPGSPAGTEIGGATLEDSPPTPVQIGSDADVRGAEPGRVIHAGHLETAAAPVTLTDAATIALDWRSGFHFEVTLTTDRVLGNPTNGIPGTVKTVLVMSDGGPDELTFGNQYGGEPPTLDDITTTKHYVLTILCLTTSRFIVSAVDGSPA